MTTTHGTIAADLASVPETYLRDELADSLAGYAERVPELRELYGVLEHAAAQAPAAAEAPGVVARRADLPPAPRVAVRGLTGSARGYLASWLQAMRNDSRFIIMASAQASKAASYILGFSQRTEGIPEPEDEAVTA